MTYTGISYSESVKYLGESHAGGSAPVWKFLTAVTVGQAAGFGAAMITRIGKKNDACSERAAAEMFVSTGVFWIVGGLTWLALTKKP